MTELRYRQVHLDFHTSEHIPGVGAAFDTGQFQEMLKLGHVDSITLFSKCHHGLSYHDTSVGVRHPHMDQELLPRQIEACRAIDVRTPIYISAGLDEAMAARHLEWRVLRKETSTGLPLRASWKLLCFNTPYLDYLCRQIEEVVERFDNDRAGIFLDIISAHRCYCSYCLASMLERGLDPTNDTDVDTMAQEVLRTYYARTTAACKSRDPEQRVFHNSGHIPKGALELLKWNSHLELESLPTGGWGYDHFPISAKYAATTGMDFLGMTGKFHTTWGEFGGFKRPEALQYECAAMLAYGAKCSIGDQLHPSGEMSRDTYALIGTAYADVEAAEPWCRGAKPVSEVALVSPEAIHNEGQRGARHSIPAEEGAARMLLELHTQFDVIDLDHDLSGYRVVVLPDEVTLTPGGAFTEKLAQYLAGGGRLLLSGKSGMTPECDVFALAIGLEVVGRSPWDPDYIVPDAANAPTSPVRGPFVIHGGAWNVQASAGRGSSAKTLAGRVDPYFNRAWNHFCSHQNTPDNPAAPSEYPAVIATGERAVYFAHDIFTRYRLYGQPLYRDLVQDALAHLLDGQPAVEAALPSAGRVTLMHQPVESRYIVHLLYATPVLRGSTTGEMARSVEVIEDIVPLYDIDCAVRTPETVTGVRLVPDGESLAFTAEKGIVRFKVPRVYCHQMVELGYASPA